MELIAHRGASAAAPESTRAALLAAVKAKADGVEFDVQMTKDNQLVVFHDDRLERTTNGRGRLSGKTYRALSRLDSGIWFGKRFCCERILLASEAVKLLPERAVINVELKRTRHRAALIRRVLRMLNRVPSPERLVVSSFDQKLLAPLARSPFACALIASRQPDISLRRAIRLGCQGWHPNVAIVTRLRIRKAHAAGLKVRVWTVDDPSCARRLMRWGADGIFTNDPKRLRSAVA